MIERAACIGVGNVGRSWAVVFARAGLTVDLWDADPRAVERALPAIAAALGDLQSVGAAGDVAAAMGRIRSAPSLEAAVADAGWVQESAAEDLPAKQLLFAALDEAAAPDAVLASSTSAIPGSLFMASLAGAARCLVAHPVNPPHLIPLVELCGTSQTAAATVDRADAFMRRVGQAPVKLAREIEGFLLNRLQWALLGEAMHLVGEGICTPAEIDRVMTEGLARRWAFLGPFAVAHLNASDGIEGYFAVLAEAIARVQATLRTDYPPSDAVIAAASTEMAARFPVADLPAWQQWRDRQLLARAAGTQAPAA